MAIQFDCPYCTSTIRVPDKAGGKMGRCPKCRTKMRVPRVSSPSKEEEGEAAPAGASQVNEPGQSHTSDSAIVADKESVAVAQNDEPPIPTDLPQTRPAALARATKSKRRGRRKGHAESSSSTGRKRRRRSRGKWLVPVFVVLMGGALIGAGAWFFLQREPALEGELSAVELIDPPPVEISIPFDYASIDDETRKDVLESMQKDPMTPLQSGMMSVQFLAGKGELRVVLLDGPDTHFYRVEVRKEKPLRDWIDENYSRIDKRRTKELNAAVSRFFKDKHAADKENTFVPDLVGLRDQMGLNALLGGFGSHAVAQIGSKLYPCVHEDNGGSLYFLLPPETKSFTLRGRPQNGDGPSVFPGRYEVKVAKSEGEKPPPSEQDAPKKSEDHESKDDKPEKPPSESTDGMKAD